MTTETLIKVQDAGGINDTRKAELLSSPVEHIDITKFDARPIIDSMGKMSFTSRDLARATKIYNMMLEDEPLRIGKYTFRSRLIVGTGKYKTYAENAAAAEAAEARRGRLRVRDRAPAGVRARHR